MNSVQLIGRLTKDVEVRYTENGKSVAKFAIAVDRKYKAEGAEPAADFINCVGFGKTAEFLEKYFSKGSRIGITGRIQTGSYTNQDGNKIYTTDVVVESVEFVESKAAAKANKSEPVPDRDEFVPVPDNVGDEGLPFN